ncbi:MAG TPA: arylesterase [Steroidobacteraceae bacterium]
MSIRSICIAFVCVLFLVASGGIQAAPAAPPTIVVLGDSLSASYGVPVERGWVALLQGRLKQEGYEYRVVNASASGETTGGALARLPRTLAVHKPALVIVELGGNDGLRGLPIVDVRRNFDSILRLSQQAGARILLVGMRIPPNYGPAYTQAFHDLYGELSARHRVPLVPFFLARVALDDALMQDDGLHPNAQGQPLLLDTLWPMLKPLLKKPAI